MASSMIDAPSGDVIAITVDTPFKYTKGCRALWVGADGDVSLITVAGQTVVFTGIKAGTILPVRATQVNASGTSVTSPGTNILAMF